MNTTKLLTLIEVARLGSVSQCARERHMAQSTVSAQIKDLEEELGVQLFERLGRELKITEAGRRAILHGKSVLDSVERLRVEVRQSQQEISGSIKLFAPSSLSIYRLPSLLQSLRKRAPLVEVKLTNDGSGKTQALRNGDLDAGLWIGASLPEGMESFVLHPEEMIFFCASHSALRDVISLSELSKHPSILTEESCGYRKALAREAAMAGIEISVMQEFENVEVVKQCVLNDMGWGYLPYITIARELESGLFVSIAIPQKQQTNQSMLIWNPNRWISPALQALIDTARTT